MRSHWNTEGQNRACERSRKNDEANRHTRTHTHKSGNITNERWTNQCWKPSKQVRGFTAMQFRQSKSYKLLHKFLLKTSSVRLHALRLALCNHRSPMHYCPIRYCSFTIHSRTRRKKKRENKTAARVLCCIFHIHAIYIFHSECVLVLVSSYF